MRSKKPFLPHMGIPPMKPLPALRNNGPKLKSERAQEASMGKCAMENGDLLPNIPNRGSPPIQIQCITCHRRAPRPLMLEDTLATVLAQLGPG